jgi:hypothetical protein
MNQERSEKKRPQPFKVLSWSDWWIRIKKFLAFQGTRKFIILFTNSQHWTVFWARWIQPISSHSTFKVQLILSSHLLQGLPSGLFFLDFPTKILYAYLITFTRATCLANLTLLNLITLIILYLVKSANYLTPPVTSSFIGQNILMYTLLSKLYYIILRLIKYSNLENVLWNTASAVLCACASWISWLYLCDKFLIIA